MCLISHSLGSDNIYYIYIYILYIIAAGLIYSPSDDYDRPTLVLSHFDF